MAHSLEKAYGLSADEILEAISKRFRLRAALEGAIAEVHLERKIAALVGSVIERYEGYDVDGQPDFSIWLPRRANPVRVECKNVRGSSKKGDEAYYEGGKPVAYKVETQKTRASKSDRTSRFYGIDQFEVLAVCMGKKTGSWSDMLFAKMVNLQRHSEHPNKLSVFQRVPLPDAKKRTPWYDDLGKLLRSLK